MAKSIFQASVSCTNYLSRDSNVRLKKAKSFVSRLLLLFLLFDNIIEGKNGEMGKLQNIFKHGMTEYPKTFCFGKNGIVMK